MIFNFNFLIVSLILCLCSLLPAQEVISIQETEDPVFSNSFVFSFVKNCKVGSELIDSRELTKKFVGDLVFTRPSREEIKLLKKIAVHGKAEKTWLNSSVTMGGFLPDLVIKDKNDNVLILSTKFGSALVINLNKEGKVPVYCSISDDSSESIKCLGYDHLINE
jgi:hypothetical protein